MSPQQQEMAHPKSKIRVSAPARLHLGFLDLNGSTGRKFGSIGLAIDTHHSVIEIQRSSTTVIQSPLSNTSIRKAETIINTFYATLGHHIPAEQRHVNISLTQLIPEHAGLGSGTQLALAIGTALCRLHGIKANTQEIAAHLGRSTRSGIGIATFDHGGFIVDGGLNTLSLTPPLLAHYDWPEHWHIVTIMDYSHQGVHGSQELRAFKELPTFPLSHSQAICHLTLMKLLPALVEQDINQFGQAITDIQVLIGDHFAPAQGGRYTSSQVEKLLKQAQALGHTGISQSSWGPTGAIFVDSEQSAKQLISELNNLVQTTTDISFKIAKANSKGASIEIMAL